MLAVMLWLSGVVGNRTFTSGGVDVCAFHPLPPTTQACILCEPQKLAVWINLSAGADLGFRQSVCNFEHFGGGTTPNISRVQKKRGWTPYKLFHCSKYVLIYLTCEACLVMVAHMWSLFGDGGSHVKLVRWWWLTCGSLVAHMWKLVW